MDEALRQLSRKALSGDSDATWQLYENMRRCDQIVPKEISYKIPHLQGILTITLVAASRFQFDSPVKPNELLLQLHREEGSSSSTIPCRWNTKTQQFVTTHDYHQSDYFDGAVRKWLLGHPQEVADALKITQQQILFEAHRRYRDAEQDLSIKKQFVITALLNVLEPEEQSDANAESKC